MHPLMQFLNILIPQNLQQLLLKVKNDLLVFFDLIQHSLHCGLTKRPADK